MENIPEYGVRFKILHFVSIWAGFWQPRVHQQ